MKRSDYQIVDRKDSRKLAEFLSKNGQLLFPMLELIEQSEMAVDELIDTAGRATIEAILLMSATELAGPRQAGKRRTDNDIRWYGRQKGVVNLAERKLRVDKPRLRRRGRGQQGEVDVPAYRAMQTNVSFRRAGKIQKKVERRVQGTGGSAVAGEAAFCEHIAVIPGHPDVGV